LVAVAAAPAQDLSAYGSHLSRLAGAISLSQGGTVALAQHPGAGSVFQCGHRYERGG